MVELMDGRTSAVDITEATAQFLKALEAALVRQQEEQSGSSSTKGAAATIVQALTRGLVRSCRIQATSMQDTSEEKEAGEPVDVTGSVALVASLLSMHRDMYNPLVHEATHLLRPGRGGGRSCCSPQEAIHVVGSLASLILLQPECE